MNVAKHTRIQIAVAVISFASLVGFAATATQAPANDEAQSFIGTAPNAAAVEVQPPTF